MLNLRPPLGSAMLAFGVAATVTPAGGSPVATTVLLHHRPAVPAVGTIGRANSFGRGAIVELSWVLAIPTADVPDRPDNARVEGDLDGRGARVWTVDRVDGLDGDCWRVVIS